MAIDLQRLQEELRNLDWGTGLTRDGIRVRWPGLPQEVYMHLPSEKQFTNAEQLVFFVRRRLEMAREEEMPEGGALDDGGPADWGESVTGQTIIEAEMTHGVGSGGDPGYTGGGSVQTGVGREGTTYGDAEAGQPQPETDTSDRP